MKKNFTTVAEVLKEMEGHKRIRRETLYVYLRKLGIRPVSELRQRPQLYPPDTAKKILSALGLR